MILYNREYISTLLSEYDKTVGVLIKASACNENSILCRRGLCGFITGDFLVWLLKKKGTIEINKTGIRSIKINDLYIKKICYCEFTRTDPKHSKCFTNSCAQKYNYCGHFALLFSDNPTCEISENDILVDCTYKQMIWTKNNNNTRKNDLEKLPNYLIISINDLYKKKKELEEILKESGYNFPITERFFNEIINVDKYIIDIGLSDMNISKAFSGGKSNNNKDYSKYTIKQLRKMVSKKGLTVTRKEGGYYRKSELISKIKNAQ